MTKSQAKENQLKKARAKAMQERQKLADITHHEERVAWLSQENPTYENGEPVQSFDAQEMLKSSISCLDFIRKTGMSVGHAEVEHS